MRASVMIWQPFTSNNSSSHCFGHLGSFASVIFAVSLTSAFQGVLTRGWLA